MEKDPFLNFISDLSEKIKISREHKQIMERVNDPKSSVNESKGSLENLILTIKEKIESANTQVISVSSTNITPLTSNIIKVVSEEENNFTDFVDKLKNILSKPREENKTNVTTVSSVSAFKNEQEESGNLITKKYVDVLKQPKVKKSDKTKNYVEELEKIKDGINVEKEDTKVTEIKKLIEEYAEKYIKKAVGIMGETGGGTVAKQFANGGTMDGTLNVTGSYLSGGVNLLDIFALQPDLDNQTLSYNESNYDLSISSGNTVNLSSINTTFKANSGKYESNFTTTNNNSASWSEAYTNLATFSAAYLSGYVDNRYFYKDNDFYANPNTRYSTGTLAGPITATLPSGAVIGDSVEFFDADGMWDLFSLIVDNNGYKIETYTDKLSCNVKYGIFKLIYTDINYGWRIIPMPRHSDPSTMIAFIP